MTYTESARAQLDALQVKDHVRILALETSCDETAAAIIEDGRTIVSNIVFSQIDLHALYGGVVPEIASRAHVEACDRVIDEALRAADMHLQDVDGHLDRHWPPGMGNVNWQALFEALSELDHVPRLLLELKDAGKIPQAMRYLESIGAAK